MQVVTIIVITVTQHGDVSVDVRSELVCMELLKWIIIPAIQLWDNKNGPNFGDEINQVNHGFDSEWSLIMEIPWFTWVHSKYIHRSSFRIKKLVFLSEISLPSLSIIII